MCGSINEVADIVADIANASAEQATGIDQVNKALSQMDEVTQQNSALVEENAATAKTLEHQSQALDGRVAAFRLFEGDLAAGSAAAKSACCPSKGRSDPRQCPPDADCIGHRGRQGRVGEF